MNTTDSQLASALNSTSHSHTSHLPPFAPTNFFDNVFLVFSGVCFAFGTVGNSIALKYFGSQRMDLPHRLYIWINVTDIVTSLLMMPMSLSYIQRRAPMLFGNVAVCQIWGVLWSITGRLSVFLVATLSITRCYQLCRPFVILNKCLVMSVVTSYALVQLLVALLPYFYQSIYVYDWVSVTCLWTVIQDIHPAHNRAGFLALYVCCVIIPTLIPIFPTIISCLMSVRAIRKANSYRSGTMESGKRKRRRFGVRNDMATNTILLITLVYILCNIPFVIFLFFEIVDLTTHLHIFPLTTGIIYIRLFLGIFSVSLNAALNPVIYYYRVKAFNRYSKNLRTSFRHSVVENSQMVSSIVKTSFFSAIRTISAKPEPVKTPVKYQKKRDTIEEEQETIVCMNSEDGERVLVGESSDPGSEEENSVSPTVGDPRLAENFETDCKKESVSASTRSQGSVSDVVATCSDVTDSLE